MIDDALSEMTRFEIAFRFDRYDALFDMIYDRRFESPAVSIGRMQIETAGSGNRERRKCKAKDTIAE